MGMENSRILTMTIDMLWEELTDCQKQLFYTAKNLPFTYEIRGGEMFVDRRSKSITNLSKSTGENSEKPGGNYRPEIPECIRCALYYGGSAGP